MRSDRRAVLGLAPALAAAALLGALSAPATAAPRDPSRLVVQTTDLGPGFSKAQGRMRPNALVARESGVPLATLKRWGRVSGYEAVYARPVDPTTAQRGAATVTAAVSLYRDAAGLRAAHAASVERFARLARPRPKPLPAPGRFGAGARMWETRFMQDGVRVVTYTIIWRERGALSHLTVAGLAGRLGAKDAVAIARRQQARIATGAAGDGPELVA